MSNVINKAQSDPTQEIGNVGIKDGEGATEVLYDEGSYLERYRSLKAIVVKGGSLSTEDQRFYEQISEQNRQTEQISQEKWKARKEVDVGKKKVKNKTEKSARREWYQAYNDLNSKISRLDQDNIDSTIPKNLQTILKKRYKKTEFKTKIVAESEKIDGYLNLDLVPTCKNVGKKKYEKVYKKNWYKSWFQRWFGKWFSKKVDTSKEEATHKKERIHECALHNMGLLFSKIKKTDNIKIISLLFRETKNLSNEKKAREAKNYYLWINRRLNKKRINDLTKKLEKDESFLDILMNMEVNRLLLLNSIGKAIKTLDRENPVSNNKEPNLNEEVISSMKTKDNKRYNKKYLGTQNQIEKAKDQVREVLEQKRPKVESLGSVPEPQQRLKQRSLKSSMARTEALQGELATGEQPFRRRAKPKSNRFEGTSEAIKRVTV